MTGPQDDSTRAAENLPAGGPPDQPPTEETMTSDGPLDKIKNAVGHAIGSEGKRHGARDTDPGS